MTFFVSKYFKLYFFIKICKQKTLKQVFGQNCFLKFLNWFFNQSLSCLSIKRVLKKQIFRQNFSNIFQEDLSKFVFLNILNGLLFFILSTFQSDGKMRYARLFVRSSVGTTVHKKKISAISAIFFCGKLIFRDKKFFFWNLFFAGNFFYSFF